MEKTFTDNYSDNLRVWTSSGCVYLDGTVNGNKADFEFDPNTAIRIAEYLLRAARKTVKDDTV